MYIMYTLYTYNTYCMYYNYFIYLSVVGTMNCSRIMITVNSTATITVIHAFFKFVFLF